MRVLKKNHFKCSRIGKKNTIIYVRRIDFVNGERKLFSNRNDVSFIRARATRTENEENGKTYAWRTTAFCKHGFRFFSSPQRRRDGRRRRRSGSTKETACVSNPPPHPPHAYGHVHVFYYYLGTKRITKPWYYYESGAVAALTTTPRPLVSVVISSKVRCVGTSQANKSTGGGGRDGDGDVKLARETDAKIKYQIITMRHSRTPK